jgi:Holliday junction resolvasome RuvABC ATP-dependent DNA helicase subunit
MYGLDAIIGQTPLKALIRPKIQLARETGIVFPHLLLCGEREQGKLTFAAHIAGELGTPFSSVSAGIIAKSLDLTGLLSNICSRQIFAISDVDALCTPALDLLAEAISTFRCEILVGASSGARIHSLPLPKFSFVGTTSKPWLVDERLTRWCIPCKLAPYRPEEATQIVLRIAQEKCIPLDFDAASDLAVQCRYKPGEANIFLQKVANSFPFKSSDRINRSSLRQIVEYLGAGNLYPEIMTLADDLRRMSGYEFERWVADLFSKAGFSVELTPASGDHGVDLWASSDDHLIAVQCKRWDAPVGEPIVRDLYGSMMAAKAQFGCLITTGSVTLQAEQFAKDKPICLIEFDALMEVTRSPETLSKVIMRGAV